MPNEIENLTKEEKYSLLFIYKKKLKSFLSGFVLLNLFITMVVIKILNRHSRIWQDNELTIKEKTLVIAITSIIILSFINGYALYVYFSEIRKFYLDYKLGKKEIVPYTITNKLYFATTNQYFFSLDDPKYLNHEVDDNLFNSCSIGNVVYLKRTINAKYVFENDGHFTLL